MNQYFDQYFPVDFIKEYVEQNEMGLERLQTYAIFRFLSAADKKGKISVPDLQKKLGYEMTLESFDAITDYLAQDLYFSPSFREDSCDTMLLYDAITMAETVDQNGFSTIKEVMDAICPDVLAIDFGNVSVELHLPKNQEPDFFAALAILSFEYPALLVQHLEKFSSVYSENFQFTCEDFVVYDFMDEYFETQNCRSNPKYLELIDTLMVATLKAQDTSLQDCVLEIAQKQLKHPYSKFAGLYQYGAMDLVSDRNYEKDCAMFEHLLEYAVTYELRSNLFDFHLDEDRVITLDNWKEKLKWYHIQYNNAYELAISSFYGAVLSRKLLKKDFEHSLNTM